MTEPQPVMEQAEQDQLTRQVGRALLTVAGDGWTQVRAEYRSAGRHIEVDVFVTGPDGSPQPVRPPQEVVEGLGKLRQGMYRPGRGTWLSAVYLLEPPSSFSAEFEPDVEPQWRRLPPPIGFADELRFFPRADEHLPDWFRQRAGMPPAASEQPPTPPDGQPAPGAPSGMAPPANSAPGGAMPPPAQPGGAAPQPPTPSGSSAPQPASPGGSAMPPPAQPGGAVPQRTTPPGVPVSPPPQGFQPQQSAHPQPFGAPASQSGPPQPGGPPAG